MPVRGRQFVYYDALARKRRRRLVLKITLGVFLCLIIIIGGVYGFFFSPAFNIQDIEISGVETLDRDILTADINVALGTKYLKFIAWGRNILLFDSSALVRKFLSEYPVLRSVKIARTFARDLRLEFVERKPWGTWCFGDDCVLFDADGITWKPLSAQFDAAATIVMDFRDDARVVGDDMFKPVKQAVESATKSGLVVKEVVLDRDSFRDFRLITSGGYEVLISLDSDIPRQIKSLKLLLDKKLQEDGFAARYFDLRIDGRIYYK